MKKNTQLHGGPLFLLVDDIYTGAVRKAILEKVIQTPTPIYPRLVKVSKQVLDEVRSRTKPRDWEIFQIRRGFIILDPDQDLKMKFNMTNERMRQIDKVIFSQVQSNVQSIIPNTELIGSLETFLVKLRQLQTYNRDLDITGDDCMRCLSIRTYNRLVKDFKIDGPNVLELWSAQELLSIPRFGPKSLSEVIKLLSFFGSKLRDD